MSAASDLTLDRIVATNSEGFRADAYDDATGRPIVAKGVITIGYGCACQNWSPALARAVLDFQLGQFEDPLLQLPWYLGCNDARRSALLEIAYNQGDSGLEHGYPQLIAAVKAEDWTEAADQCTVEQDDLKPRYARIARILSTGIAA